MQLQKQLQTHLQPDYVEDSLFLPAEHFTQWSWFEHVRSSQLYNTESFKADNAQSFGRQTVG